MAEEDPSNLKFLQNSTIFDTSKFSFLAFPPDGSASPETNSFRNSYLRIVVPLKSSPALSQAYTRFYDPGIRVGKTLELMDFIAARICYRHLASLNDPEVFVVTASVEGVDIHDVEHAANQDLVLEGFVSYTGRTTMEVKVVLLNENSDVVMNASFIFVARARQTPGLPPRPHPKVPQLDFSTDPQPEIAKLLFEQGLATQERRRKNASASTAKSLPSPEEMANIHSTLMSPPPPNSILMSQAIATKFEMSHVSDKNLQGTVFGGLLMKGAFELGFVTAYKIGNGSYPRTSGIGDTTFFAPVPPGSILFLTATPTFALDDLLDVNVTIDVMRNVNGEIVKSRTNEINIFFKGVWKQIMPVTYREAMLSIEGARRIKEFIKTSTCI